MSIENDYEKNVIELGEKSREFEQAVIGCLLKMASAELIMTAKAELTKECFYDKKMRSVFSAIIELSINNAPVDIVTVSDYFENNKSDSKVTNLELIKIADSQFSEVNYVFYIKKIIEYYQKREALKLIEQSKKQGIEGVEKVIDFLKIGTERLARIDKTIPDMRQDIESGLVEKVLYLQKNTIKTFSEIINYNLGGGLIPGRFFLLTGTAGVGKTAFLLQLLDELAKNKNICIYAGSEMTKDEMFVRSISRKAEINSIHFKEDRYFEKISDAIEDYRHNEANYISIWETDRKITVDKLKKEVNRVQYKYQKRLELGELPVIILAIDPIQDLSSGDIRIDSNSLERVAAISCDLKALARDLNVVVIGISETTKEAQRRESDKEFSPQKKLRTMPGIEDVRGSYEIVHKVDITGHLQSGKNLINELIDSLRFDDIEKDRFKNKIEIKRKFTTYARLLLSKQRYGPKVPAYFIYYQDLNKFKPIEIDIKHYESIEPGENESPF